MKRIMTTFFAGLIAAGVAQADGLAASLQTFELVSEVSSEGVTSEVRIAPDSILPQDRIEVVATLSNEGEDAVTDVSFVVDIHHDITIDIDSITGVSDLSYDFSTFQNPTFFDDLEKLTISLADGTERAAVPEDLTSVRIHLDKIDAAKKQTFGYTATVR